MLLTLALTALAAEDPVYHPVVATLDNGLTVIVEEQHRTDEVALYLRVGVGSRDEREGEHGLAHLFEHLMFEGSAHVPRDQFDTLLTAAGGANNAWTSDDETVYHMVFPSGALDLALFLESDRLGFLDAGLDQENLDNQREIVLQERATGYDAPGGRAWDLLQEALWAPPHPYAVPTIGTVADLQGASLDVVRAFWEAHYRTRNAVLVIVGNVDAAEAHARVAHWFGDLPDRGPAPRRAGQPPDHRFVPRDVLLEDDVDDRTVVLAWPAPASSHPDAFAASLLASILSGGRGTRLDDRLYYRSRLSASVGASWDGRGIDGAFVVQASSSDTPLPRLVRVLDAELARLVRTGPSQAEVDRAVRSMVNAYHDGAEDLTTRAETFLYCWQAYGLADCEGRELDAFRAVTPADVQRVARGILLPRRRSTLSLVPRGDTGGLPGAEPLELP